MNKIEKLVMFVPEIEREHYLAILKIANKVDEIIDVLNQNQLERLTDKQVVDLIKHTDQNRELNQLADKLEKQKKGTETPSQGNNQAL